MLEKRKRVKSERIGGGAMGSLEGGVMGGKLNGRREGGDINEHRRFFRREESERDVTRREERSDRRKRRSSAKMMGFQRFQSGDLLRRRRLQKKLGVDKGESSGDGRNREGSALNRRFERNRERVRNGGSCIQSGERDVKRISVRIRMNKG